MDEGYEPVNFIKNGYKALNVNIKKSIGFEDLEIPAYSTKGACAVDLRAAIAKDFMYLSPGDRATIHAGFSMAIPKGFEAQIRPRSGLAIKNGISLVNSPGTIDSDYRGPVGVILINHGTETFKIERGMRIAQMTIHETIKVNWQERKELSSTMRDEGGFGSTGHQ